jgi:hypothetical protein
MFFIINDVHHTFKLMKKNCLCLKRKFFAFFISALISACGGGQTNSTSTPPQIDKTNIPALSPSTTLLQKGSTMGIVTWPTGSTTNGGRGTSIAGVNCLATEDYHIHAHLSIFKDGRQIAIPANIGLQGCAYELHTHDLSGIIHVETSVFKKFSLGQFFAVWGQPLSRTNIAGMEGVEIRAFTNDNGILKEHLGELSEIEITPHRSIIIQLGAPVSAIPFYTWDGDL